MICTSLMRIWANACPMPELAPVTTAVGIVVLLFLQPCGSQCCYEDPCEEAGQWGIAASRELLPSTAGMTWISKHRAAATKENSATASYVSPPSHLHQSDRGRCITMLVKLSQGRDWSQEDMGRYELEVPERSMMALFRLFEL